MAIPKWIKWLWDRASYLSTAVSFVPQIGVVIVAAVLGWVAQIPAFYLLLAGLNGSAVVTYLFKNLPHAVAWSIVGIFCIGTGVLGVYQYYNYELEFVGIEAALVPSDLDRTYAAGEHLNLQVENKYDFPLFVRLDRNYIVSERAMADRDSNGDTTVQEIAANSVVDLPTRGIVYNDPLPANELRGGSLDALICYGRSRSELTKGLAIKANYQIRFFPDGNVDPTFSNREVKHVSCN